jgi:hypothetical protein
LATTAPVQQEEIILDETPPADARTPSRDVLDAVDALERLVRRHQVVNDAEAQIVVRALLPEHEDITLDQAFEMARLARPPRPEGEAEGADGGRPREGAMRGKRPRRRPRESGPHEGQPPAAPTEGAPGEPHAPPALQVGSGEPGPEAVAAEPPAPAAIPAEGAAPPPEPSSEDSNASDPAAAKKRAAKSDAEAPEAAAELAAEPAVEPAPDAAPAPDSS